ncbi:phosphoribosylaminoimidazole synthetase [Sphaerochaeta pleomorpha str. Grapes]|uniref:Phosphoribosylformylglycinamidine cyclo-ligase n=1 Tax=Sphaerochaeta pleomorpha (strain ATCC BAA-1885 / DSM 22778 / Grapes) TaxID=158190 RepID=G8QVA5_SPHPG|nr:phosphoribosylformylglycinamidine cyclo-ligase [Sphaerochaeta pleomorpha]AEV30420.1 phosphoribosylaminoimidazole synthetase [Sphaerochaeta pleomorpha str. Grapes]
MNSNSQSESYRLSGVDINAGYKAVELMKSHVARTLIPGVRSDIGGFGGLFELDLAETPHPLLVSGTDGVGTKLKLAFLMDRHESVGIDCVAMCVNDVICCGAKPVIFLDYIALGKTVPAKVEAIVKGVAEGCVRSGCALIGGETAEMPGFYSEDEYDLAGFTVGVVDRDQVFAKETIEEGDILIALPSSGVHSNGFSLVRKVFNLEKGPSILEVPFSSLGKTLGEALLEPTAIYVKPVLALAKKVKIKAAAHITGGGFYENIPRCLPEGKQAVIKTGDVRILPIFDLIQKTGKIPMRDMFNTFNMGVGMVLVLDRDSASLALQEIPESYILGTIENGEAGVVLC